MDKATAATLAAIAFWLVTVLSDVVPDSPSESAAAFAISEALAGCTFAIAIAMLVSFVAVPKADASPVIIPAAKSLALLPLIKAAVAPEILLMLSAEIVESPVMVLAMVIRLWSAS